ncbi:MAG: hypothetical protein QOG30_712, partial [Acidimicrobiaceae bacterium]
MPMSASRPTLDALGALDVVVAPSAAVLGTARVGRRGGIAQGTVIRSVAGHARIGAGSFVLENSVVIGRPGLETTI